MQLDLPTERKVCLVGAGDAARLLCKHLLRSSVDLSIITNFELDSSWSSTVGTPLCSHPVMTKSVNPGEKDELKVAVAELMPTIIVVAGWPAFVGASIRDSVGGRIFNYHPSELPVLRGAATASWAVMCGTSRVGVSIHQLTGKLDAGPLLIQYTRDVGREVETPIEYLDVAYQIANQIVFPEFAGMLASHKFVTLRPQEEAKGVYFPALLTPMNGVLQFSWSPAETVRFVRAFSAPYPGAALHYRGEVYRIREAAMAEGFLKGHPFVDGLISNRDQRTLYVHVRGGIVAFGSITDSQGQDISPKDVFRIGDRLVQPPEIVARSLSYRST
ncbi:MAG: formyltransferase family protein [Alphaproteobacteria bacterium]